MSPPSSERPRTLVDRIFLYGIRALIVVAIITAVGVVLTVHGILVTRYDYIASGLFITILGVTIGFANMRTSVKLITKPYFAAEAMTGKTGRALGTIPTSAKGVVHIEHEQWSAVAEDDIGPGDLVVVTAVDPDKVTLRVRRQSP